MININLKLAFRKRQSDTLTMEPDLIPTNKTKQADGMSNVIKLRETDQIKELQTILRDK